MNEAEARLILQSYQPGAKAEEDPRIAEALQAVAADPQLARWWEEEQAFDRAMAAHLEAIPAPFGLQTRILAQAAPAPPRAARSRWGWGLAAAAAALVLLAGGIRFWRGPAHSADLPAEYAREMASFIQLAPPLEMESADLAEIKAWLAQKDAKPMQVPARLAALEPLGCRILSFRGHDVTLICFQREGKRLAHLFAVDRTAMPKMNPGDRPIFANEHGWMTATWVEGDQVYMVAMQGGRAQIEQYLPNA